MKNNTQDAQIVNDSRKTYARPNLRRVGQFKDLTRTNSNTQYQIDIQAGTYGMS